MPETALPPELPCTGSEHLLGSQRRVAARMPLGGETRAVVAMSFTPNKYSLTGLYRQPCSPKVRFPTVIWLPET